MKIGQFNSREPIWKVKKLKKKAKLGEKLNKISNLKRGETIGKQFKKWNKL